MKTRKPKQPFWTKNESNKSVFIILVLYCFKMGIIQKVPTDGTQVLLFYKCSAYMGGALNQKH